MKSSGEPMLARFWRKYQVQLQKVRDIRWVSQRELGPYYRHWPVKYHIACEHAQQNDAIWEDVTSHPPVTPFWHSRRGGLCIQGVIIQSYLQVLSLSLSLSNGALHLGEGIPSEQMRFNTYLFYSLLKIDTVGPVYLICKNLIYNWNVALFLQSTHDYYTVPATKKCYFQPTDRWLGSS